MNFQPVEDSQEVEVVVRHYNPGSDFMNLLGIGSTNESVIIKGQNFEQMKNLADDIKSYIDDLSTINNSKSLMFRTINLKFIFFLIWTI